MRTLLLFAPRAWRISLTTGRTQVVNSPGPFERIRISIVDSDTDMDITSLIEAIQAGDRATVQTLTQTWDQTEFNDQGSVALITAAEQGDTEILHLLIEANLNVNQGDEDGWTPLMEASAGGYVELVKQLLTAGANANTPSNEGITPLMAAAAKGHTEVVTLLVEQGADLKAKDKNSWTALIWASAEKQSDMVNLLQTLRSKAGE
ncbi:MAG TPA: hypothetical protein DD761_06790 [Cyanobacteria bacterium UBA11691]|nr:hypothetical protein [Cyanobacteria bacterium UBA11691]